MSSKITAVYNAYISFVSGKLTSYKRLPNPYNVSDNPQLLLKKGYGVLIGPGTNSNRFVGCKHSTDRAFTVVLTNQMTSTDSNATAHGTLEKNIMEDAYVLRKAIETDVYMSTATVKTLYVEDSGIEYIEGESNKYLRVSITFSSEYIEDN